MKLTIESTPQLTEIDGVPVRHWEGTSEEGVKCHVFIHRIAVGNEKPCEQFETELREMGQPQASRSVPLHLILD